MKNKLTVPIIIIIVVVIAIIWAVGKYNKLVQQNEACSSQWSKVESQYQRRMDLIPNIVSTVKGYAKHEQETLQKVIEARNNAAKVSPNEDNAKEYQNAQNAITTAMRDLNVVVERYPDLKANQNFLELQSQLEGTENRIAVERQKYADVVQQYNQQIKSFPTNLVAGLFGFSQKEYFAADQGSKNAPKVSFE